MALATDQQAMLKLLLERGQGYAELAVLLGIDEAEVRRRARGALTELAGADPDRGGGGVTDYLLGQADPIDRADAVRHLRESPEDRRLAGELADRLRQLYPAAELPRLPGEPRPGRFARRKAPPTGAKPSDQVRRRRATALTAVQTRTLVILASVAVIVIAVVLAVSGAFDGGEQANSSAAETTAPDAPVDERAVPVQLEPVRGSDAGGVIVFGFATADQPFIEFQIRRLDPPANDKAYILWFLTDGERGFPLPTPLPVQANGVLDERIAVPATTLSFVQQAESIAIALNDPEQLDAQIKAAVRERRGVIPYPGGTVLTAQIQRASPVPEG